MVGREHPDEFERLGLSAPSPAVRSIVDAIRSMPTMDQVGVDAARHGATRRSGVPKREDVRTVTDHVVTTADASFAVRTYRARPDDSQPIVVYFHAGGWILGDLEHSDHLCRRLANRTGAVVVNVDYRLAPEAVFPAAFDDCLAAVAWARDNAASIGGDAGCLALAGESSGGGLAAAVALELSRAPGTAPDFLLLLEPALDSRLSTPSWEQLGQSFAPARVQMDWMWSLYAPDETVRSDPRVSPAQAPTIHEWHPPTLVVAAEYDPLRDEAMNYAAMLSTSGTAVSARIEPGLPHAFCNLGGFLPEGLHAFDTAVDEMNAELRRARPSSSSQ